MKKIFLYDTTLRDGTQRENLSLSVNDKVSIARRLDAFGIPYIEGGWPGSNPKDAEFFERIKTVPLEQAKICAFGATRYKDISCDDDANLQALLEAATPVVTLVGKSWDLHATAVIETTVWPGFWTGRKRSIWQGSNEPTPPVPGGLSRGPSGLARPSMRSCRPWRGVGRFPWGHSES